MHAAFPCEGATATRALLDVPNHLRMEKAVQMWKALTAEEQKQWKCVFRNNFLPIFYMLQCFTVQRISKSFCREKAKESDRFVETIHLSNEDRKSQLKKKLLALNQLVC